MTARGSELKGVGKDGRSTVKRTQPTEFGAEFTRFINYKPSETDKMGFQQWAVDADVWALMDEVGSHGFKLTVAYDEVSKAYNGMLMDRRTSSAYAGCILSVRGPEFTVALLRVVYVHVVIAKRDWKNLNVPDKDDW